MMRRLFRLFQRATVPVRSRSSQRPPLSLEALETRLAPAVFVVTNLKDSGNGSLRQAILDANALAGTDTIQFNIKSSGVQTIAPTSALPTVTGPVVIDGYSQPGSAAATAT